VSDVWAWSVRGGLKPKFYRLPRAWSLWGCSPVGKIPTAEPGIEPGTSWLVVRSSDHQGTRLGLLRPIHIDHAVPLLFPCRFKDRFTHTMPFPCHHPPVNMPAPCRRNPAMAWRGRLQKGTFVAW
jgi:hypothetical protein